MSATEQSPLHSTELRLTAIAVSRGLGIGQAVFLPAFELSSEHREIVDIERELERLHYGVERARTHIDSLASQGTSAASEPISGIFDTHLLILESFAAKVEEEIKTKGINAEWAIDNQLVAALGLQADGVSAHLKEKQVDIKDVAAGILDDLRNSGRIDIPAGSVIVAREILPSTVMDLSHSNPAAIVSRRGGWTSHASIVARELGIPMVTGVSLSEIADGDVIVADGFTGRVIIRPSTDTISAFRPQDRPTHVGTPSVTLEHTTTTADGTPIRIKANSESVSAYETARAAGADGIGLFRSESIIQKSGRLPTETQQTAIYADIASAVGSAGVSIRTFDIGPDTFHKSSATERNPALGLRSIRFTLSEPAILRGQMRAILRANEFANISTVVPMVSGVAELRRFRELLNEAAGSLGAEGVEANIPKIGAMIEVPSAVFTAREIAAEVDFFCLGTNDLVQYLLAVDRDNERVAEWYQTLHPAVLRALREVITAAECAAIPVTVCGEMAGSPFYIPLLIGLGVREFSMSGNSIAAARRLITGVAISDAENVSTRALNSETAAETIELLRVLYSKNWAELFPSGFLKSQHS